MRDHNRSRSETVMWLQSMRSASAQQQVEFAALDAGASCGRRRTGAGACACRRHRRPRLRHVRAASAAPVRVEGRRWNTENGKFSQLRTSISDMIFGFNSILPVQFSGEEATSYSANVYWRRLDILFHFYWNYGTNIPLSCSQKPYP